MDTLEKDIKRAFDENKKTVVQGIYRNNSPEGIVVLVNPLENGSIKNKISNIFNKNFEIIIAEKGCLDANTGEIDNNAIKYRDTFNDVSKAELFIHNRLNSISKNF